MMPFLALLAAPFVLGLILMAVCLFNAPEGYEDEAGFHIAWHNNRPDLLDAVCIWIRASESGATKGI